jgi:hypothetical protein
MGLSRQSLLRGAILVSGLLVSQLILFGPSLIGRKILLPLDVLALPGFYLPPSEAAAWGEPWDSALTDPTLEMEMDRRYAVAEVRAGRLPLWNPHEYCGQPFLAANQTAVFSPFRILDYLWPGTLVIAWDQVLKTMVAGIGAYLFFRVALRANFVPALFGGWVWPICGYYIQWAGHPLSAAAAWLPWMFLFTDGALREPRKLWGIGLALATAASLLSGHAATSAQVLLADAVFFVWRAVDLYRWSVFARSGPAVVIVSWILGAALSAPQSLPTVEYLQTSHRIQTRLSAGSETPPAGWRAIPQLVLPDFNGSTRGGAVYFGHSGNELESASTGYVGLITALVLAPIAWCDRMRRSWLLFAMVLAIIGVAQIVAIPGLKNLYDSFPLNALRQNRMALASGWAILIAGVAGLNVLLDPDFRWNRWLWLGAALPAVLGIWCLLRAASPPEGLHERLALTAPHAADEIIARYSARCICGFVICLIAVAIWLGIARGLYRRRSFVFSIVVLAVAEAIFADFGVYPQSDPGKYYPPQPILTQLANAPPGRVCGVNCFPACLTESAGLLDVRGYDATDPQRLLDLCLLTRPDLLSNRTVHGGILQGYYPTKFPSAVTRLMNLRYLIFPGHPPAGRKPGNVSDGFWVYEDRECLPRVFVPKKTEAADDSAELQLMARPDFDPREVAYTDAAAPKLAQAADGEASISSESPCHVTIDFDMRTPGVVVLSDTMDAGWRATINGTATPVLRVNHNFRGVLVSAGKGVVQYDYEPASFYRGLRIAALAGITLLVWTILSSRTLIKQKRTTTNIAKPA